MHLDLALTLKFCEQEQTVIKPWTVCVIFKQQIFPWKLIEVWELWTQSHIFSFVTGKWDTVFLTTHTGGSRRRTVTSPTYFHFSKDFRKRNHLSRSVFQRWEHVCVYQYQVPCVDLFLHLGILVHICWSRPVVHAVFTTTCQEMLTNHEP